MTKQEIREGLALIIFDWETCATGATDNYGLADKILKYIKFNGGVIKIKRELPDNRYTCEHKWPCSACGFAEGQAIMVGAGYVAVEELI